MPQENKNEISDNTVVTYRLDRLEEAVSKLSQLSEVVLRWDARFQAQGGLMQCGVHAVRMDAFDKRLEEIYKISIDRTKGYLLIEEHEAKIATFNRELDSLKAYMNKAVGALVIISILIQLAGPIVIEHFRHNDPAVVTQVEGLNTNLVGTLNR